MQYLSLIFGFILTAATAHAQVNFQNFNEIDQSSLLYINQDYNQKVQQAEKLLEDLITEKQIPGLSITIATKDEIIWSQAFGYADLENKSPTRLNTKFRIGSISKALTSLAIGKLIENGQLDLNEDVRMYVPYFPEKRYTIKVKDLANHTSGIRNYNYRNGEYTSRVNYETIEESVGIFKDDSLLFEPGSRYSYATYNYSLLSAVIEGASGLSYIDYMNDEVIHPLNLNNTSPDYNSEIILNRASFYDVSDGEIVNGYYVNNSNKWAGGGYLSTSFDLALMSQQLLHFEYIKEETLNTLWEPASLSNGEKTNYAVGWRQDRDSKDRIFMHHGGSSIGGRSFLLVYPEEGLSIAITCNLSTNFREDFVIEIAQIFIDQ